MASAIYDTVSVDINAGEYLFKGRGSTIKFKGFLVLYQESQDNEEEEENAILPELSEGEVLEKKNIIPKQHFTQPPPRYTEATLVKALEERGYWKTQYLCSYNFNHSIQGICGKRI